MIGTTIIGLGVLAIVGLLGAGFVAIAYLLSPLWAALVATLYLVGVGYAIAFAMTANRADRPPQRPGRHQ